MRIRHLITLLLAFTGLQHAVADDEFPTIRPTASYVNDNGVEEESTNFSGSAPLVAHFRANPSHVGSYTATYEWRFTHEGEESPYLIRYEEDTDYTFTEAGSHSIELWAFFVQGNDTIAFADEYWRETGAFTVSISESKLEMPNAFSPNGDSINDVYKAKEGYQSLVEFKATIYNRWGQKLYEWDDPAEGWDGTFQGKGVRQGVYYVLVRAKGADGRKYNIRRDVNRLRGYNENTSSTAEQ